MKTYSHPSPGISRVLESCPQTSRQRSLFDILQEGGGWCKTAPVIQACWNPLFRQNVEEGLQVRGQLPIGSIAKVEKSKRASHGLAFIVNAILPYSEVKRIPEVVAAMMDGLPEAAYTQIAIVLGVNAPEGEEDELESAIAEAEKIISTFPIATALVKSVFKPPFPYGTMRNVVLHSEETRLMTEYFLTHSLHPYVSVQDFDTGSRKAGWDGGEHVFNALYRRLVPKNESERMTESIFRMLPLLVGGGYRAGSKEKEKYKASRPGYKESDWDMFSKKIEDDMLARDMYAKSYPLLPYIPEPNLFIDATAAYQDEIKGEREPAKLAFGPRRAEYTALAKKMNELLMKELQDFYDRQYKEERKGCSADELEIVGWLRKDLKPHSQNATHPIRGVSFYTNFRGLAVETDLSRLAREKQLPQTHDTFTIVVDRVFDTKKDKNNVSLGTIADSFSKEPEKDRLAYAETLRKIKRRSERLAYIRQDSRRLRYVKCVGGKLSRAISVRFSSKQPLFKNRCVGIPLKAKRAFLYEVATKRQLFKLKRRLRLAQGKEEKDKSRPDYFDLQGNENVSLRVKNFTTPDGHCGVYALSLLLGESFDRNGLINKLASLRDSHPLEKEAYEDALSRISGDNFTRWLSDDDLIVIGKALGLENMAVVQLDYAHRQWVTMQGDPEHAPYIVGAISTVWGGSLNHWVVLERKS